MKKLENLGIGLFLNDFQVLALFYAHAMRYGVLNTASLSAVPCADISTLAIVIDKDQSKK